MPFAASIIVHIMPPCSTSSSKEEKTPIRTGYLASGFSLVAHKNDRGMAKLLV
jgi:hypothetical protein